MADLTGKTLTNGYPNLVTIGATTDDNPSTGTLENGKGNNLTSVTVDGDITIADKIIHSGNTDTAIRFPADDTVAIETAGSEAIRIDSSGNLGVGLTTPKSKVDMSGGVLLHKSQEQTFDTGNNQFEDFELFRFATSVSTTNIHSIFHGNLFLQVSAFRGVSTNTQNNRFITASLVFGNFPSSASADFGLGTLNIDSNLNVKATSSSNTLTVALVLEYSTDGGTSWVSLPNDDTNSTGAITGNALYRCRANLTGTTPASFVGEFRITTALNGYMLGNMTVDTLGISII